jgi:hypothetical protein
MKQKNAVKLFAAENESRDTLSVSVCFKFGAFMMAQMAQTTLLECIIVMRSQCPGHVGMFTVILNRIDVLYQISSHTPNVLPMIYLVSPTF